MIRYRINEKQIITFSDPYELLKNASQYNKDTPIYIDVELNDGIRGENISKELHDLGFTEIYLATGHSVNDFDKSKLHWIKDIVGKHTPF